MQAFLAILRYDLGLLTRSWITRIWVPLLVIPALFLIAIAANEDELASETLAFYLRAILIPISGLAVAVLAAAAVSGESGIIADGILSRSVTRTEYIAAKVASRLGFTAAIYAMVMIPFSYLVIRYAAPDTTITGVIVGLLLICLLLTFLGALGITFSTLFSNVLFAVLMLMLIVIVFQGAILQFLGLTWMSTTAVVIGLPDTFRGATPTWDLVRIFLVFSSLTAAAIATSFWVFRERDL